MKKELRAVLCPNSILNNHTTELCWNEALKRNETFLNYIIWNVFARLHWLSEYCKWLIKRGRNDRLSSAAPIKILHERRLFESGGVYSRAALIRDRRLFESAVYSRSALIREQHLIDHLQYISTLGKLNNLPDHGGNWTRDLWFATPMSYLLFTPICYLPTELQGNVSSNTCSLKLLDPKAQLVDYCIGKPKVVGSISTMVKQTTYAITDWC